MKHKRLITGIFLLATLISILTYSGLETNNHDPSIEYILDNFENYKNTQISFKGVIEKVNTTNKQLTISIPRTQYLIEVKTDTITETMKPNNQIEILGILNGKYHVSAEKTLVVEKWKADLVIIRSIPAIPLALYLFFRTWRFNKKTYRFKRRKPNA